MFSVFLWFGEILRSFLSTCYSFHCSLIQENCFQFWRNVFFLSNILWGFFFSFLHMYRIEARNIFFGDGCDGFDGKYFQIGNNRLLKRKRRTKLFAEAKKAPSISAYFRICSATFGLYYHPYTPSPFRGATKNEFVEKTIDSSSDLLLVPFCFCFGLRFHAVFFGTFYLLSGKRFFSS